TRCDLTSQLPERLAREHSDVLARTRPIGCCSHTTVEGESQRGKNERCRCQSREHGTTATSQAQLRLRNGRRLDGCCVAHSHCLSCSLLRLYWENFGTRCSAGSTGCEALFRTYIRLVPISSPGFDGG